MEVKITLLFAASFLFLTSPTFTVSSTSPNSTVPVLQEDFPQNYKLALLWPNSVCNVSPCVNYSDKPTVDYQSFLIHGLWPSKKNCGGNLLTNSSQLQGIEDQLRQYWPNLLDKDDFSFWQYQWEKHGTCSGLNLSTYFNATIELRNRFPPDLNLSRKGCPPRSEPPYIWQTINDALFEELDSKVGQLICDLRNDGSLQLVEIRICFDRQKNVRNCSLSPSCGNNTQALVFFPNATINGSRTIQGYG